MEFRNEPLTDWARAENRERMAEALHKVRAQFGRRYDPVIEGKVVPATERAQSALGNVGMADRALADRAVTAAQNAFAAWRATSVADRAAHLQKAAALMRARRFELAAWMIFEVAKTWTEADADVAEAIDFLEYYSREAQRLFQPQALPRLTGVKNSLTFEPLGAGAVIAPWNFPLAILTGMAAAALAAGNTVILKPAEQSPVIAAQLMEIFAETLPPGVAHYLPGAGEIVGTHLVAHAGIDFVAFTGSTAAGQSIRQTIAASPRFNRKVILETGGKNAIFVDRDADLDQAVQGVLDSAFSYSGQKCSACSRLLLHAEIYDTFLKRLTAMAQELNVGAAEDPATHVGPLIDAAAFEKVARYAALAGREGKLELAPRLDAARRTISPTIVSGIDPQSALAQEEIFGPLLAVFKARDVEHAIALANDAAFGLTAGIFTRSETRKQRFFDGVRAGVIYANRKITHAQVGIVPFGGISLSGTGTHAGGPEYLRQFVNAKTQIDELPLYAMR